jgi:hypothetical protein
MVKDYIKDYTARHGVPRTIDKEIYKPLKLLSEIDIKLADNPIINNYYDANIRRHVSNISFSDFMKIVKFYTKHSSSLNIKNINYSSILSLKIIASILDLYTMLYIDNDYPWQDMKYAKRLERYIFFIFVDNISSIKCNKTISLFNNLGIYNEIVPQSRDYVSNSSIEKMQMYFGARTLALNDSSKIIYSENNLILSSCSLDHFMFNYHLIDFLSIKKHNGESTTILGGELQLSIDISFVREQFIIKQIAPVERYLLISISSNDYNSNYLKNIPNDLSDPVDNPDVVLSNTKTEKRYINIETRPELFDYIKKCEDIRERLLITAYDYSYECNAITRNTRGLLPTNIHNLVLNTYEGDIDRILHIVT